MNTLNLGAGLEKEELAILPPELKEVALNDRETAERNAMRRAIFDAFICKPRKSGLWNTFNLISKYRWPLDDELKTLLFIAIHLRFNIKAIINHFELGMISDSLRREEVGSNLNESPWKEKFLANAQIEIPDSKEEIRLLIEVVERSGIDKLEYVEVLRELVRKEEAKNGFTLATFKAKDALSMFTTEQDDHVARLLREADQYLRDAKMIYRSIDQYQDLQEAGIDIGESRRNLVKAFFGGVGRNVLHEMAFREILPREELEKLIKEREKKEETETKPWWKFW